MGGTSVVRVLRARLTTGLALVLMVTGLTLAAGATASAATVGYKGPYYGVPDGVTGTSGIPGSPTAQKPQSKLWYTAGSWWGALWNDTPTNTSEAFTIHRYDWASNTWVDTGVKLETRTRSDLDVLWSDGHLYVASNSDAASVPNQVVEVSRYTLSGGTWTFDWTTPVANAYVYSPVIEKDSTGLLWMTYTQGTSVMISHSMPGSEQTWVTPYQLPTPNGESTVSFDPSKDPNQPSSDIASIVTFDDDKVGVLWSNQRNGTVYWASHQDGADDQVWATQIAFKAPEGADDHINLKSVIGTEGGRVYAVTKTSMNGTEPIIEVLVLRLNGTWDHFAYANANTNLTRPIILLDTTNRELYVFAAAGETANSGGAIYYKKTSMTSPDFGSMSDRGTVFISDDALTNADPANTQRINNPSSTKQTVNASTGLLVVANNDPTDYYYYNRMDLSAADTTAPDTTITANPAASTESTTAEFSFTSTEAGSTFQCKLDAAAYETCTSPKSYTGLTVGSHTFSVRAADGAGNVDGTPATYSWTVVAPADTTAPETTITDQPAASTDATTASFSFTSTETGSTFQCRLDQGPQTACTSPKSYTGLSVGQHVFAVRAKDAAGNVDGTPATYTWTVVAPPTGGGGGGGGTPPPDTTAPETTITAQPASSTTSTTADFSFTSTESGSTFGCSLDGAAFGSCTSPKQYSGLATGTHRFSVQATDAAGNTDATPATYKWSIKTKTKSGQLFADDFASGDFASGGWRVSTRDGSATVTSGAARASDLGAVLKTRATSRSAALISKTLDARQRVLRIEWRALVTREAARGHVAQLLRVRDNHGRVVLTLVRVAGSGRLAVVDRRGNATWAGRLRVDRARLLSLTLQQKKGHDAWTLSIGSRMVASDSDARTGNRALRGMTFGAQGAGRLIYGIDDVTVSAP